MEEKTAKGWTMKTILYFTSTVIGVLAVLVPPIVITWVVSWVLALDPETFYQRLASFGFYGGVFFVSVWIWAAIIMTFCEMSKEG